MESSARAARKPCARYRRVAPHRSWADRRPDSERSCAASATCDKLLLGNCSIGSSNIGAVFLSRLSYFAQVTTSLRKVQASRLLIIYATLASRPPNVWPGKVADQTTASAHAKAFLLLSLIFADATVGVYKWSRESHLCLLIAVLIITTLSLLTTTVHHVER